MRAPPPLESAKVHTVTYRQMNLNVFQGRPIPHVLFQPRIESWYQWHEIAGDMPSSLRHLGLPEVFDELGSSMRYVHHNTGIPDPVVVSYGPDVRVVESLQNQEGKRVYQTPHGELEERLRKTPDEKWRVVEHAAKSPDDLRRIRWLYRHTTFSFSEEHFLDGSQFVRQRGEPQFWVPRSPYQALAIQWMGIERLVYALADCPDEVEETMRVIDQSYDRLYDEIAQSRGAHIINFGENIHDQLLSPRYFETYLMPFYEKRSNQLRAAGIFTHIHIDGNFRSLLKYFKNLPFDGLEALTPAPQGDVPLEQLKEHIGDKILLDGIPSLFFLSDWPEEELLKVVDLIVALFHPRLVLGVSDEVPQGSGEEALRRLRMVSQWCRSKTAS